MKFRLHITYDYEVDETKYHPETKPEWIAETDLKELTSEKISVDQFIEVLGGRLTFAIEPLPE